MPLLLLGAACSRGNQSKEAIRQGVLDHLKGSSVDLSAMDMEVTEVQFSGDNADATVTFKPKGMTAAQGMALRYRMQQKGGRWAVVAVQDSGHSNSVPPGVANPHGAGGIPTDDPHSGVSAVMPSPDDLPPIKK
jgi:hypothetical protein